LLDKINYIITDAFKSITAFISSSCNVSDG